MFQNVKINGVQWTDSIGLEKHNLLIFSYLSVLAYVFGAQKNRLIL